MNSFFVCQVSNFVRKITCQFLGNQNTYEKDVWISGGYTRLADILRVHDMLQAKVYLEKAKKIIDSNPKLTIRKQQWEKLASLFRNQS